MKRLTIGVLAATFGIPTAYGACPLRPQVLSKITVYTCQSVTIEASASKGTLPFLNHRVGEKLSGVLLGARVDETELVWPKPGPHHDGSYTPWNVGSMRSLFVAGTVENQCPAAVPTTTHVVTTELCCDTIPLDGLCIVAPPIDVVRQERQPEHWHTHQPGSSK